MNTKIEKLKTQLNELHAGGKYPECIPVLEELLELLKEQNGIDAEYVAALNDLGGVHRDIGNTEIAEKVFLEAIQHAATVFGTDSPDYATTINNTAGLYRVKGDYEKATDLFKQAFQIYDDTLGSHHFLTISSMNNLGLVYQAQKKYELAKEMQQKCIDYLDHEKDPVAYATSLVNYSTAKICLGEMDVESHLAHAMKIYEETTGTDYPLYTTAANTLATLLFKKQEYEDALSIFRQIAIQCMYHYGENSRNYATALNNIAAVCLVTGRTQEAQETTTKAMQILNDLH